MDFAREGTGVRRAVAVPVALACSALLFYFGTGFTPVAALTWLAPLPVLLLAPRVSAAAAAGVAFVAYLLGTANSWAFQLGSHDMPMWPVGVMINLGMTLVFVLTVLAFRLQLRRGRAVLATLTAPAVWTGSLYLVSVTNPMGLMGTFANHQADVPLVLQVASVTGMWGVEFLVLLAPAALATMLTIGVRPTARLRATAVAAAVLVVALGTGALRLAVDGDPGRTQRVAAIATNQDEWAPDLATPAGRDLAAGYAERIAALPDDVETVVLPEASFRSDQARPTALVEPLHRLAVDHGIDIVVGFVHRDGRVKYNYALTFPAQGGDPVSYLKHHDQVSPPGHELVFPATTGARLGIEICFDVNFPNPSRDYAAAGAQILAVPASDEAGNGWQHSRAALLRGMENGQAVIWSARRGNLMIADGWGRVLADARTDGPGQFTSVVADVPIGPGATPYTHLGDWFAWLCLAIALGGLVAAYRPSSDRTAKAGR